MRTVAVQHIPGLWPRTLPLLCARQAKHAVESAKRDKQHLESQVADVSSRQEAATVQLEDLNRQISAAQVGRAVTSSELAAAPGMEQAGSWQAACDLHASSSSLPCCMQPVAYCNISSS